MTSAHFYATKDGIYRFPPGTVFASGGLASPSIKGGLPWREIRAALTCDYGAFPQRYLTGLTAPTTTKESPLPATFTNHSGASITVDSNGIYPMLKTSTRENFSVLIDRDLPAFLQAVISRSPRYKRSARTVVQDGKPSIKVGDNGAAGIVYKPTTQDQAERNLNFALANLAAYLEWERVGKAEAERKAKREAEEKAAAERRAKAEAEANLRRIEQEEADGIRAYNKAMGTSYRKFSDVLFMGSIAKKQWIELGKAQKQIDRDRAIINPLRPAYNPFAPRPWL